ncbi:phosphoribosyl-ATP pyrophosphohydrolase [Peribacillus sp. SCS-37]|uniref:phosphoribosyl-ATP pyrophosphohydrolase n=1 Tax=Paraperibacillus esterisolvens TaxID=3115296 RepID=UPI003905B755
MPIYKKLVRDLIPQVIKNTGAKFSTKVLDNEEYKKELKKKSFEELEEYIAAPTDEEALEELADLLEIIHALAAIHGGSIEEVEKIRKEKTVKRGGFKEKIFLIEVEDE